tara:strand:- start:291 stop:482 length:192 start_codon:yes stop_codon:yes gene_type:complete
MLEQYSSILRSMAKPKTYFRFSQKGEPNITVLKGPLVNEAQKPQQKGSINKNGTRFGGIGSSG